MQIDFVFYIILIEQYYAQVEILEIWKLGNYDAGFELYHFLVLTHTSKQKCKSSIKGYKISI